MHAALLATLSGISLPIGAVLGILLSPVQDLVCAAWVAFGAGALLFAVTVELYGHDLRELDNGRVGIHEMLAIIFGAFIGALFYLAVNRWLEDFMDEEALDHLQVDDGEVESDGHSQVGSLRGAPWTGGASERTPLMHKPQSPTISVKGPTISIPKSPMISSKSPNGTNTFNMTFSRDESFCMTYNKELDSSRNVSFSRYPFDSRNASFAYSDCSFKSRSRDRVIAMLGIPGSSRGTSDKGDDVESIAGDATPELTPEAKRGNKVAFGLFMGLLVDGVPEGVLMGFLAAEGHLSEVLVISLMVANFPEAFSSASLMVQGGVSIPMIISMWTGLCAMVGVLAGASCYILMLFFPSYPQGNIPHELLIAVALIEGLAGGAMISCIATVMLPEAFARGGGRENYLIFSSGFLCTAGFLVAVTMKAFEHHYYEQHSLF